MSLTILLFIFGTVFCAAFPSVMERVEAMENGNSKSAVLTQETPSPPLGANDDHG